MKFLRFALVALLILPVVLLCVVGMLVHGVCWSFMQGWRAPQAIKANRQRAQEIKEAEEFVSWVGKGPPWF